MNGEAKPKMKILYAIVFLIGVSLAVLGQFVCIAIPRETFIASKLADNPDSWEIRITAPLDSVFNQQEVKAAVAKAMEQRSQRSRQKGVFLGNLIFGIPLLFFSTIGFVRELQIDKMRKRLERSPSS
jgi:hypothetical protein